MRSSVVVDLDAVALHPAMDLHPRFAELATYGRDIATVPIEQGAKLGVARDSTWKGSRC